MEWKAFGFESYPRSVYRAYVILSIFIAIHIEVNYKLLFNVTMKLFNYILSASKQLSLKGLGGVVRMPRILRKPVALDGSPFVFHPFSIMRSTMPAKLLMNNLVSNLPFG